MNAENIEAAMPLAARTVFPTEPMEAGKGGEGGDFQITNKEFIAAVFPGLPEGAFSAVSLKERQSRYRRMASMRGSAR